MKYTQLILLLAVVLLLTAGCILQEKSITADQYNCTIDGVVYNITAGICHGEEGVTPSVTPSVTQSVEIVVTPTPVPTPTPVEYVECSDYHKIVDKWKTPDGNFVKLDDNTTIGLIPYNPSFMVSGAGWSSTYVYGDDYNNISIGEYAKACVEPNDAYSFCTSKLQIVAKLKPVSEEESGYRDACEIIN